MNLFVLGWKIPIEWRRRAARAVLAETASFPLLDPATQVGFDRGPLFASCMQTPRGASTPRVYCHATPTSFTLFDGLPVAPGAGFEAHDASQLARRWKDLPHLLEGQFTAAHLDAEEPSLEVITDPLGLHQTYRLQEGEAWLVSNSVRLLTEIVGGDELDLDGAAHFQALGWLGGERTLRRRVRVIRGGQRWAWGLGSSGPTKRTYFAPDELSSLPRAPIDGSRAGRLAHDLAELLASLSRSFAPLECPITGGRDSRMMTGLLVAHGLHARYFTSGVDETRDVRIGVQVARQLGLDHEVRGHSRREVADAWEEASARLLRRTDGMVTLAHVKNAVAAPTSVQRLKVQLYGACGEVARGDLSSPAFFLRPPAFPIATRYLQQHLLRSNTLASADALAQVRRFVGDTAFRLREAGFSARDLPDAFYLAEHGPRWSGAQFRQVSWRQDVFSPFCSRAYARAAFSVPALDRYLEHVPFRLLEALGHGLLEIPFDRPWRPRSAARLFAVDAPGRVLAKARGRLQRMLGRAERGPRDEIGKKSDRLHVLETWLPSIRSSCLDRTGSDLWGVVNRARFEQLTSPSTSSSERRRHYGELYRAVTLFRYEETTVGSDPALPAGATSELYGSAPEHDPVRSNTTEA